MRSFWSLAASLFVVAAMLGALLAACGGDDPTPTSPPTQAPAEQPEPTPEPGSDEYFAGKTIRVVIPYTAGGSSSVLVPYFAHQLPNYIPGNPRMISSHITPVIAGYNFMAKANNDGTEIMYSSAVPLSQQYTTESDFDVSDFEYLIGYTSGESILMINGDVPFDDVRAAPGSGHALRLPIETDPTEMAGSDIAVILTAEAFGYDLDLIPLSGASTGTAELLVAMERGDVDGQVAGAIWYTMPSLRPGWTADGVIKPVAFFGRPGQAMAPNTETDATAMNYTDILLDGSYSDEIEALYNALVIPQVALGKHFLYPPDTDPEAVAILRKAFDDAMADPVFVKGLDRLLGAPSINFPGVDLQETVETAAAAFADGRETRDARILELYNKYTQ